MNKTIHRVWLNEEPPPPALQRIGESWAGEDVRLWTREDIFAEFDTGCSEVGFATAPEVAGCIQKIWGNSIEAPRAFADWVRVRILQRYGGLYVDMDCEKKGDVWDALDWKKREDFTDPVLPDLIVCRPLRPFGLKHPRPCNGVLYACEPPYSGVLDAMRHVIETRLWAMAAEHSYLIQPDELYRPVHTTGPDLLHAIIRGREGILRTPADFAAFKGCETPDTRIVIHQGWRQYDA